MDFSTICRTCLDTKYLNPIFKNGEDHSRYSTAIFITTGLKVEFDDGLPQHMCKICVEFLNDSLKFRKRCKDAEIQLTDIRSRSDNVENYPKDVKVLRTMPLNRKKSKDSTNNDNSVNIKIERDFEQDDEIPLQSLLKNLTEYEDVKSDSIDFKIDINYESYKTNNRTTADRIKNNNIYLHETIQPLENLTDGMKYEEEYLEPQFETDSETELDNMLLCIGDIDGVIDTNTKKSLRRVKSLKRVTSLKNNASNMENIPFIVRDSNRVTCKLCQKDLSKRSIDSHMAKRHPGADMRKVKCDLCDTYVLKERLNRHKIIMHGRDCFRCGYCKTEFDTKEVLLEHVVSCTAKNRKRNPADREKRKIAMTECDECHKVMQKASLRMHKEIKHAGMGPVCEHCGRRFGNKFRLQEHLRSKHGYEKYKCTMCDFHSASMTSIRNHERRHRGEKPFVCETCDAKFHAPHLLAQHRHSHRTQKVMKCDQCPAAFKARNTLHMHKMTCHNSHTYQCTMCPRVYSCRHYAVKHLRNVHRYVGPVGDLLRASAAVLDDTVDTRPTVVAVVQRVDGTINNC